MAQDDGERTEEATQTRREEFRNRGQVAHSRELGTCLILLASTAGVFIFSRYFFEQINQLFSYSFGLGMVQLVRNGEMMEAARLAGEKGFLLLLPVLAVATVIGVSSSVLQIGFLNVEDAIAPNVGRLNPIEGLSKIFSFRSVIEIIKSFFKLVVVIAILYMIFSGEIGKVPYLITYSVNQVIDYIGIVVFKLLGGLGGFMLIIAAADYFLQRWDLEKKMMMTKQEIKEEHKSREGDPLIKSRIRRIQRETANRRMMDAIPKATVVVTNPTHIAVVLKYDDNLPAPQLVAKGADLIAEKIKKIARENNVPIVENKPLARTIYKTLKIGQVIPRELFVAVAEVLSYIFRLRKRVKR